MTDGGEELPAETGVGRVALIVRDIPEVADFYESVIGLAVHDQHPDRAVLGDGETALLELQADPTTPDRPKSAAGLFHTAFRVPSRGALGDALYHIESSGQLTGTSDHLVSKAVYCRDPEGNGVEVYRDRSRSAWELTAEGEVPITTEPLDTEGVRNAATGASGVPVGTDVGHIHLEVTDLDAARAFYGEVLGMGIRTRYDGALFLAAGDYHHHVGVNVWNKRSEPTGGRGLAWFEFVLPDEQAVRTVREGLAKSGYAIESTPGGVSVTDPDGTTVRLRA